MISVRFFSLSENCVFGLPEETTDASSPSPHHTFPDPADVVRFRSQLLNWYNKEKRELPWRTLVKRNYIILLSCHH